MEMTSNYEAGRRLYKSRTNRMIDGVCGGIAEYFGLDPTIVRVVWVLFTLLGGTGIILYIAAMIVMPINPDVTWMPPPPPGQAAAGPATIKKNLENRRFWGIVLILIGAMLLMTNLGWFAFFDWFHLSWEVVFPVILILLGAWLIGVYLRRPDAPAPGMPGPEGFTMPAGEPIPTGDPAAPGAGIPPAADPRAARKELRRSITDRKLFGVCGGIAQYFGIDPTIVRIGYVMLVVASFGWGLLLYIILAFLLPEERITEIR